MNKSEIKDNILKELIKTNEKYLSPNQIKKTLNLSLNNLEIVEILKQIKSHPLNIAIVNDNPGSELIIKNENTGDFINTGGFLKYDLKQKRKEEKELYDYKISKWLVKTKWWPLVISFGALVISIISIFIK